MTSNMRNNRRGMAGLAVAGLVLIAIAVTFLAGQYAWDRYGSDKPLSSFSDKEPAAVQQCLGIASVSKTFDDKDKYVPGTDPGQGNLFIISGKKGVQSEGAITLAPGKKWDALAGQNATAYFAEPVSFETSCISDDLIVDVTKSGAPTITITNDNGVTLNADATAEATAADSVYEPTVTVKAPSKQCSSRHGALLIADYDKTYVQKVEFSSPLVGGDVPDYLSHVNGDNSTSDGFSAALFKGELCDGAKVDLPLTVTTASTAGNEGNANVVLHWLPLNYDVNQDTYALIGPAAEDEDNNVITLGNTTAEYHTD